MKYEDYRNRTEFEITYYKQLHDETVSENLRTYYQGSINGLIHLFAMSAGDLFNIGATRLVDDVKRFRDLAESKGEI
jgi:hypothetical protein